MLGFTVLILSVRQQHINEVEILTPQCDDIHATLPLSPQTACMCGAYLPIKDDPPAAS